MVYLISLLPQASTRTTEILDEVKKLGFKYATSAGVTIGMVDIVVPESKKEILQKADQQVEEIENPYVGAL